MAASLRTQATGYESADAQVTGVQGGDLVVVTLRERDGSSMSVSDDVNGVNAAGGNFHLDTGSPAETLGRVVGSIGGTNGDTAGAYITGSETIGRT